MALESTIAGSWYPGTEGGIRALAEKWEKRVEREPAADGAEPVRPERPNVLLLPHAGWAYSGETAWRAVRLVRGAEFRRVVVLAPSHRAWIENRLVAPESSAVSTPLGQIAIDREWLDRLDGSYQPSSGACDRSAFFHITLDDAIDLRDLLNEYIEFKQESKKKE